MATVKKLYISKNSRIIGGVCGGLGEYLNVDPNMIRVLLVIFTLISLGIGLLAYLIAWIILPEK